MELERVPLACLQSTEARPPLGGHPNQAGGKYVWVQHRLGSKGKKCRVPNCDPRRSALGRLCPSPGSRLPPQEAFLHTPLCSATFPCRSAELQGHSPGHAPTCPHLALHTGQGEMPAFLVSVLGQCTPPHSPSPFLPRSFSFSFGK